MDAMLAQYEQRPPCGFGPFLVRLRANGDEALKGFFSALKREFRDVSRQVGRQA